ncbi:MAG TPA: hypothetical protein VLX68_16615 [Chitinivibrionales bacterium]|nr:hypothetical protein [Chitinivibrionales bacterium]
MKSHTCKAIPFIAVVALVFAASSQTMQVGENSLGVSGDMNLRWIGKGIPGKLFDADVILSEGMIADSSKLYGSAYDGLFRTKTTEALASLYFHPGKVLDLKLSMPFLIKQGPEGKTGPFGDLMLDIGRSWGTTNLFSAGLTLGFPVGYSTIMSDNTTFLSSENQVGNGLFSATARASYAFAPDWGIINIGASYAAGLFAIRTSEYGYDQVTDEITYDTKAFQVARDGWGAKNDAGVVTPDRIGLFADFGIKTEVVNHGFSIGYYYPTQLFSGYDVLSRGNTASPFATRTLAQAFLDASDTVADQKSFVAGQKTDSTWAYVTKTTLHTKAFPWFIVQYNIEKNDPSFPIFLGGMVKMDYDDRLNFSGFSLGIGFKFPIY